MQQKNGKIKPQDQIEGCKDHDTDSEIGKQSGHRETGSVVQQIMIGDIETREVFSSLFPILPKTLSAIAEDIGENGYDKAHPVVMWGRTVVDGHTRVEAARQAGLTSIPVVQKEFADEDTAISYAIHTQRDRRNLTDSDIIRLVEELDRRRSKSEAGKQGRNKQLGQAQRCASPRKSATVTAEIVGASTRKIEQARAILDHTKPEVLQQVKNGTLSINQASKTIRSAKKKKVKPPAAEVAPATPMPSAPVASADAKIDCMALADQIIELLERMPTDDGARHGARAKVKLWLNEHKN
jgi:ParB-like chromosome segregation protein Spo0J